MIIVVKGCTFSQIFKITCNKIPYIQNDDYELVILSHKSAQFNYKKTLYWKGNYT